MLDTKSLRANLDQVAKMLSKKGFALDTQEFLELDEKRKKQQTHLEELQKQRNELAKKASTMIKGSSEFLEAVRASKIVSVELSNVSDHFDETKNKFNSLLLNIPNIPHEDVPEGQNEEDNKIVRHWGQITDFDFTVKDHVELGKIHNKLDFATAANISSSRFVVMHAEIARLHRALIQFMLDTHTMEHGFKEVYVPQIVNDKSLTGTGQLPKFADDLFALEGERNLFLIPTSEVPLMNIARDQVISAEHLPLKYTAHSSCYRSEAGSYGRDTQGMIRQHQFDKVELVKIVAPDESQQALEELTNQAEKILQLLELPYRVSMLCGGDLGFAATQTYDLEVWLPGQNTYREISSCSNCTDFQTRRINIKWTNPETNKKELLHSLNGSGLAIGRTLIAIMENYQQKDGSIVVPDVLHRYMQGTKVIEAD